MSQSDVTMPVPAAIAPGTRSLTVSTLWLMSAKTIGFALTVALPLLIVRRLNQTEFGHYKQIFLVITTATNVLPFGFAMTGFYFFPRNPERREAVISTSSRCAAVWDHWRRWRSSSRPACSPQFSVNRRSNNTRAQSPS